MAHKNRPKVHGGLLPVNPQMHVAVPAPMVSQRRTPPGHVANLELHARDVTYGLLAMETIPQLSRECLYLLTRASGDRSASQRLVQLLMNRVPPKMDLISWLENYYLGTWDEPYQAVAAIAGPSVTGSFSRQQLIEAYERATQAFMLREHYLDDGKVAVFFTEYPDMFGFLTISHWVIEGEIPPMVSF